MEVHYFVSLNPLYIPAERGGPAVVVADSQNNRIVEYQRKNESWKQSWQWQDVRMQWPLDADRLPNGNTLIADYNGGRVIEVNETGDVVWKISTSRIYDVERLGTGDESSGGQSAEALTLQSRTVNSNDESDTSDGPGVLARVESQVRKVVPSILINSVAFVLPVWLDLFELLALVVIVFGSIAWGYLELRWRGIGVHWQWPLSFG